MKRTLLLLPLLLPGAAFADSLTGKAPSAFYKDLLQVSNGNTGVDGTLRVVEDGEGTDSCLWLSASATRLTCGLDFAGTTHAGLRLNGLTTAQRDALTPSAGMLIHNTTTGGAQEYDGTAWQGLTGALTPTSVAATGNVTGANLSGTNTGDQTIALTGAVVGSGTGTFATAITAGAVTAAKIGAGAAAANVGTLGGDLSGTLPSPAIADAAVTSAKLAAGAAAANVGALGGDLSGSLPSPTVTKINGSSPAAVATSGSYNDLSNRPTLGTAAAQDTAAFATAAQGTKADGALAAANNLSDLGSAATARTNLGLGTAATTAASAYATASQGAKADSALQPANNLGDLGNAGTARNNLGLGSLATLSSANLASNVSGTLPIANGGTGQASANAALNAFLPSQGSASGKYLKSDGTNASWGAAIPSSTWAGLPSASSAGAGVLYFVSDIGPGGCLFVSNGTSWRPASGVCNLGSSGTAVTATGTGSVVETTFATIAIPANLMGTNGQLLVHTYWSFTNSANTKTPRIRFGGASGTVYQGSNVTTNATQQLITRIANAGAANSQKGFPSGTTSGTGTNSTAGVTSSVDTTSATSLVISGAVTTTGEVIALESYSVELIVP